MTLPSNGPLPPFQLAAAQLREEIASGRLKPGDRLPSSRDLIEQLGISNATVHAALRVLRDEGLIYSVQGRGSYVADPKKANEVDPLGELATEFTGEFSADYVPPAWYAKWADEERHGPAERGASAGKDPQQTAALIDILLSVRDQIRQVTEQVDGLKRQVSELEDQVSQLRRSSQR